MKLVRAFGGRQNIGLVVLIGLVLLVGTPIAHAQFAPDTDFTVERFRLSSDRNGIFSVESAEVLPHLSLDVGLWIGYADAPLNLYQSVNGADRERIASLVSRRLTGSLVGAFSVLDRLQIGVELPFILNQDQDVVGIAGPPDSIKSGGVGDLRLLPKVQILNHTDHFLDVALGLGLVLPTATSDDYFGDERLLFQPELLLSGPITDQLRFGFNIGYRNRKEQEIADLVVGDEVYGGLGAAYRFTDVVELAATFNAATSTDDFLGTFNRNYAEAAGGLTLYFHDFVVFAAGGVGTGEGFGTPDWRALGGVRFGLKIDDAEETPALVADEG